MKVLYGWKGKIKAQAGRRIEGKRRASNFLENVQKLFSLVTMQFP